MPNILSLSALPYLSRADVGGLDFVLPINFLHIEMDVREFNIEISNVIVYTV